MTKDPLTQNLWTGFYPLKRRIKAIATALYYGVLPWQWYENDCHYEGWSYWQHLKVNVLYALKWICLLESVDDIVFEKRINNN